jgi:hypothetical protein
MAESSAPLSPHAPPQDPRPNQAPASAAAKRPVLINGSPLASCRESDAPAIADKRNRKQSQQSLEIFIKVTGWLAVNSGLNKHSQNQVFRAARLVLLVGGGAAAAWLLPSTAVPESRVASGAPAAALSATARVTFKIIIPKVLYVRVGNANENVLDPGNVAVMSNSHNATLNAALRTLDSNAPARGNLILNSAARKGIAQNAHCSPTDRAAPAAAASGGDGHGGASQIVCTVSMP